MHCGPSPTAAGRALPTCIRAPRVGPSAAQCASRQASTPKQSLLPEGRGKPALSQKSGLPVTLVVDSPGLGDTCPVRSLIHDPLPYYRRRQSRDYQSSADQQGIARDDGIVRGRCRPLPGRDSAPRGLGSRCVPIPGPCQAQRRCGAGGRGGGHQRGSSCVRRAAMAARTSWAEESILRRAHASIGASTTRMRARSPTPRPIASASAR